MKRNWSDFKSLNGNIAGAREAFEDACETLFRKKYKDKHVSQVKVNHGDGGIDIFIGELGEEPITVIQCKFFLNSFENSQKAQIRKSFKTAIDSKNYELKEWILCIPRVIDIEENSWWFKWKHKQLKNYSKKNEFIKLTNGNELIDLFKELELYNRVFEIDDLKKINEIHEILVKKEVNISKEVKVNNVLFNNYSKKNEPFYLERETDIQFKEAIEISNIWIFGKSGYGKTALVNRNLIQKDVQYCFCDLSPISITKSEDVLNEILITIEDKFSIVRDNKENNILKQISKILCLKSESNIIVVIDELSVPDENILKEIANSFIQLVTYYSNQSKTDGLKFVVSTIADPKIVIENRSKASALFEYICCNEWEKYSSELFDTLSNPLNLNLTEYKETIIDKSKSSPRVIKNIFKKIVVFNDSRKEAIEKAIKLTLEEIVD